MFNQYTKTVAIGPYLSCEFHTHIQSFALALDKRGLALLKRTFRCPRADKDFTRLAWIIDTEVRLGRTIVLAGLEMRSLLLSSRVVTAAGGHDSSNSTCPDFNPTREYPVSADYKSSIYAHDHKSRGYFDFKFGLDLKVTL
jgi:hypothetical protein